MIDWEPYKPGRKLLVKEDLSKEIILSFAKDLKGFFAFGKLFRRPKRTRWVKDMLAELGDKKGYKVYANGLSPDLKPLKGGSFKNTEWLYDLHWYTEGEQHYTTTALPLVMECEWQPERKGDPKKLFSGIKYDFQKLLVTNADFRLMVFRHVRTRNYKELFTYFENNIFNYTNLADGSKFLFIVFCDKDKTFFYKEIFKRTGRAT